MEALGVFIDTLLQVIEICFPTITISTSNKFKATMRTKMTVSPAMMVRLRWRKTFPDVFTASLTQCYQLKDIYLSLGMEEWQVHDPTLVEYFQFYDINTQSSSKPVYSITYSTISGKQS
jgi:hypothetical protein